MSDEPCVCARPIDLRSDAEIQAEIDHLYAQLARRLRQAGRIEEAQAVLAVPGAQRQRHTLREEIAEPA